MFHKSGTYSDLDEELGRIYEIIFESVNTGRRIPNMASLGVNNPKNSYQKLISTRYEAWHKRKDMPTCQDNFN